MQNRNVDILCKKDKKVERLFQLRERPEMFCKDHLLGSTRKANATFASTAEALCGPALSWRVCLRMVFCRSVYIEYLSVKSVFEYLLVLTSSLLVCAAHYQDTREVVPTTKPLPMRFSSLSVLSCSSSSCPSSGVPSAVASSINKICCCSAFGRWVATRPCRQLPPALHQNYSASREMPCYVWPYKLNIKVSLLLKIFKRKLSIVDRVQKYLIFYYIYSIK